MGISALALLALVSVALGGQSIWALRIHQTTTYFTGMLTRTINAGVSANAGIGTSLRQLGALLAGAILSRVIRTRCAPLLLLAAAATVDIRIRHQSRRSRS